MFSPKQQQTKIGPIHLGGGVSNTVVMVMSAEHLKNK